jgi:hypothetical protein
MGWKSVLDFENSLDATAPAPYICLLGPEITWPEKVAASEQQWAAVNPNFDSRGHFSQQIEGAGPFLVRHIGNWDGHSEEADPSHQGGLMPGQCRLSPPLHPSATRTQTQNDFLWIALIIFSGC